MKKIQQIVESFKDRYVKEPVYGDLRITNGKEYDLTDDMCSFLTTTLTTQQEGFKKMVEEMKKENIRVTQSGIDKTNGYNQALDDLLTKLNQE